MRTSGDHVAASTDVTMTSGFDFASVIMNVVAGRGLARRSGHHGVVACSALKRRYRDVLIGDHTDVRLVYLKGDETLIARCIATRHEHFMPRSLLHSQFDALEQPGPDEDPIVVSVESAPREIVAQVLSALSVALPPEQAAPKPSEVCA